MKKITLLSILAAGLVATAPAHAQWYVGAGIGATDAKLFNDAQDPAYFAARGFSNASLGADKRDTGGRVYGGYEFLKYFAVELGYADLGKVSVRTNAVSNVVGAGSIENRTEIKASDLSVIARWPASNDFSVFGRVGVFASEAKSTVTSSGSVVLLNGDSASYKKHDTKATFGLGGEYRVAPKVSVRGEWMRYQSLNAADVLGATKDISLNFYSVGVIYRF